MNEWMAGFYINQQDEDRQSLIKDADLIAEGRENVRCSFCGSYVYRKDSKRVDNITVCNICIDLHKLNVDDR